MSHIHLKSFAVLTRPVFHYKNLACLHLGVHLRIGRGTFKVSNRRENIFIYYHIERRSSGNLPNHRTPAHGIFVAGIRYTRTLLQMPAVERRAVCFPL